MTPSERVDAFFERLHADPDLSTLAVMLGPYRAMTNAPSLIALFDALSVHWAATANVPVESET